MNFSGMEREQETYLTPVYSNRPAPFILSAMDSLRLPRPVIMSDEEVAKRKVFRENGELIDADDVRVAYQNHTPVVENSEYFMDRAPSQFGVDSQAPYIYAYPDRKRSPRSLSTSLSSDRSRLKDNKGGMGSLWKVAAAVIAILLLAGLGTAIYFFLRPGTPSVSNTTVKYPLSMTDTKLNSSNMTDYNSSKFKTTYAQTIKSALDGNSLTNGSKVNVDNFQAPVSSIRVKRAATLVMVLFTVSYTNPSSNVATSSKALSSIKTAMTNYANTHNTSVGWIPDSIKPVSPSSSSTISPPVTTPGAPNTTSTIAGNNTTSTASVSGSSINTTIVLTGSTTMASNTTTAASINSTISMSTTVSTTGNTTSITTLSTSVAGIVTSSVNTTNIPSSTSSTAVDSTSTMSSISPVINTTVTLGSTTTTMSVPPINNTTATVTSTTNAASTSAVNTTPASDITLSTTTDILVSNATSATQTIPTSESFSSTTSNLATTPNINTSSTKSNSPLKTSSTASNSESFLSSLESSSIKFASTSISSSEISGSSMAINSTSTLLSSSESPIFTISPSSTDSQSTSTSSNIPSTNPSSMTISYTTSIGSSESTTFSIEPSSNVSNSASTSSTKSSPSSSTSIVSSFTQSNSQSSPLTISSSTKSPNISFSSETFVPSSKFASTSSFTSPILSTSSILYSTAPSSIPLNTSISKSTSTTPNIDSSTSHSEIISSSSAISSLHISSSNYASSSSPTTTICPTQICYNGGSWNNSSCECQCNTHFHGKNCERNDPSLCPGTSVIKVLNTTRSLNMVTPYSNTKMLCTWNMTSPQNTSINLLISSGMAAGDSLAIYDHLQPLTSATLVRNITSLTHLPINFNVTTNKVHLVWNALNYRDIFNVSFYSAQIDHCAALPCDNNGTCTIDETARGYTCVCDTGFFSNAGAGPCTVQTICTRSNPCRNGGTCIVSSGALGFTCTCPSGFTGIICDSMTSTSTTSSL